MARGQVGMTSEEALGNWSGDIINHNSSCGFSASDSRESWERRFQGDWCLGKTELKSSAIRKKRIRAAQPAF